MTLAVLSSCTLAGLQALPVRVEVHVSSGLPTFSLVGLPGAGVRESRERVRSALISSGFDFPAGRITANLAPADLPKETGRFDLPIALGVLLASGQVIDPAGNAPDVRHYVLAGELSLTGVVMPADAALAIALSVRRNDPDAILLMSPDSAQIASQVPGLRVLPVRSLSALVAYFAGKEQLDFLSPKAIDHSQHDAAPCMADVKGQSAARFALEIAAAGGHGLLMSGAPGVGKSMLAQRLPGLLPPLNQVEALEVAALHGLVRDSVGVSLVPPFRAPHHGASMPALVGGGPRPRPGEISLAHHGVLFLDEMPEFDRRALEALREPMETGSVSIARVSGCYSYPARFQLIAAMNPCPCGWLGHPSARHVCRCSAQRIERYKARLSGPLLDRIDLHVALSVEGSWMEAPAGESSALIRARVFAARDLQRARQGCLNSQMDGNTLMDCAMLDQKGSALLARAAKNWGWSARASMRVLRIARTLADLRADDKVLAEHIAAAIPYRPGIASD